MALQADVAGFGLKMEAMLVTYKFFTVEDLQSKANLLDNLKLYTRVLKVF
jgi:hypothetical protein